MLFIVSVLTILAGIARLWFFLSPIFSSSTSNELNPVLLVSGIMYLIVGWGLFRRNEFALELGFWLWFGSLIWNSLTTALELARINAFALPQDIPVVLFLLLLLAVHLFAVIFLSQKETKRLFFPDSAEMADMSTESKLQV